MLNAEAALAQWLGNKFFRLDGTNANEGEVSELCHEVEAATLRKIKAKADKDARAKIKKEREIFKRTSASAVLTAVAYAHDVTVEELTGRSRVDKYRVARHHACHILRNDLKMSYQKVASFAGMKDHTTARHACIMWKRHLFTHAHEIAVARELLGLR